MKCFHIVFSFFHPCLSSQNEISSRQKCVNSKRHFIIDSNDFIPGRVSSQDEISCVNTLSIDSGNFSVRGYLPLIQKDSSTHMHGFAVYVKERLPFTWDLSLENSADSYICFQLALFHSVFYFFFLYGSPSSSLCMVFDSISSNIDEVLLINPSANIFVFGDFNVHHNDWLIYSSRTD